MHVVSVPFIKEKSSRYAWARQGMETSQLARLPDVKSLIYLCPHVCCLNLAPQVDNSSSTTSLGF